MRELTSKTACKRMQAIMGSIKNYMDAYWLYYTIENTYSRCMNRWSINIWGKIDGSFFTWSYLESSNYMDLYAKLLELQENWLLTKQVDNTVEWMHNRIMELRNARMQNA